MNKFWVGLLAGAALAALGFSFKDQMLASTSNEPAESPDEKGARCPADQLRHNRQLVRTFFTPTRTPQDAYDMMTPDYIQHNEGVKRFGHINGMKDREAFLAIDEIMTKNAQRPELLSEPGRPKNDMASKIIATCDYVIAVHRIYTPDPQKVGAYYTAFDFELWRIKGGKFAEHWDSQRIPTPIPDLMLAPMPKMPTGSK